MTCGKTQGFLANRNIAVTEQVNATKNRLGPKDAVRLAREADTVHVARGKKVISFDMKRAAPSDAELLVVMLGPTGNLRAPTWRKGRTLVVGFDEATYTKVLKL